MNLVVQQIHIYGRLYIFLYHSHDILVNILAVKHLLTLTVNDLTLSVHYVVIIKNVLSDVKVSALYLLLGRLDYAGKHF